MEANKRQLRDIFNGGRVLEIPFFQRSYVWDINQWERLIDDLEAISEYRRPYFMGSVILKQQQTSSSRNVGDKRTLIDGQQRLTTLAIFFRTYCLLTNTVDKFERLFTIDNSTRDLALLHNQNDISDFTRALNQRDPIPLDGSSKIIKAFNFFLENIDVEKLDFDSIVYNIMFVNIDLGVDEDEQQIFDTINSLGVRLTTAELLKNYFFSRDNPDAYEKHWRQVFEIDEDTKNFWDRDITAGRAKRENIDLFFYSFLQIKIQDPHLGVRTEDKKLFTKVEGLFESYKKFIKDYNLDKEQLIQEINEYASLYRLHINYDVIDGEIPATPSIDRINAIIFGLDNTTLIPYVLYVIRNVSNNSDRNLIWQYLESYIMRRMVCHMNNKNYNNLFSEKLIANEVLSKDQLSSLIENQSDTHNGMPSDEELNNGFHNSWLVNKQSAGILYLIESAIRNSAKHSTALLGMSKYSLEHLMPKKWQNKWPELETEEQVIYRNKKLLTLGNLTIVTSSLNASMRDSAWEIKKEGSKDKHGLKHYAGGIETFSIYLEYPVWNEDCITERAEYLYNKAREVWLS
jgi:uncharacterized protein with ParB-like and HNH nuclease domain